MKQTEEKKTKPHLVRRQDSLLVLSMLLNLFSRRNKIQTQTQFQETEGRANKKIQSGGEVLPGFAHHCQATLAVAVDREP